MRERLLPRLNVETLHGVIARVDCVRLLLGNSGYLALAINLELDLITHLGCCEISVQFNTINSAGDALAVQLLCRIFGLDSAHGKSVLEVAGGAQS